MISKIIFLDFDGVIRIPVPTSGPKIEAEFCSERMKRVARLAEETRASIVISSDWRTWQEGRENMAILLEPHIPREFLHEDWATPVLFEATDEDRTPRAIPRGAEIVSWLADHGEVDRFAILDDMHSKHFPLMRECLVTCQLLDGFTEARFEKALEILTD